MEYNLKNLISNLASQPFCLSAEENVSSSLLNCDFYLNGLNNSTANVQGGFCEKRNNSNNNLPTENISLVPDLSKETFSFDNFLEDDFISSLQQTGDDIFDNINFATPLVNDNNSVNSVFNNQISVTSSTSTIPSIADLSFDLLESLEQSADVDETSNIAKQQNNVDDLQFDFMETAVSEVSNNMNNLTSSSQNMALSYFNSNISVLQEGKQTDADFVNLSPQSVDSGISMGSSPTGSNYGELSVDLNDFFNLQNAQQQQVNNWNFEKPTMTKEMFSGLPSPQSDSGLSSMASSPRAESPISSPIPMLSPSPKTESPVFDASAELLNILSMAEASSSSSTMNPLQFNSTAEIANALAAGYQIVNIASPPSVCSSSSVSDESNCDSENYLSDQSNFSPMSLQQLSPASSNDVDFSNETGDGNRFKPYSKPKKEKTPAQKQRKKTQNRSAASRYRSKKKGEFSTIDAEANKLEEKNKGLKDKVEGLRKEIDYLKSLMLDVINARLSKKPVVDLSNLLQTTA